MNQNGSDKSVNIVEQEILLKTEMEELKRDMRSAQWQDWAKRNQQSLVVASLLLAGGLVAGGMWLEHSRSQQAAAATLYQQAVNEEDKSKKSAYFNSLVSGFSSSSYAALAEMQLAVVDSGHAEEHLKALEHHPAATDEWKWQARLDLASLKIEAGDKEAAAALLQEPVGKEYQQLRYYLLATIAKDADEKKQQLQKALDAASPDEQLKQKIQKQLALLAS